MDADFEIRLADRHEFEEAYLQLITPTWDLLKISVIPGSTISVVPLIIADTTVMLHSLHLLKFSGSFL